MIFSYIPNAFATSDSINKASAYFYTIKSAEELFEVLGGEDIAELDGDKVTMDMSTQLYTGIIISCDEIDLDLNGNTICFDSSDANIMQLRSGILNIEDSAKGGSIKYYDSVQSHVLAAIGGTIVLNGGTIAGINAMGGNVEINGGDISTDELDGVLNLSYGSSAVMNSGCILGKQTTVNVYTSGDFVINGGKITSLDGAGISILGGSAKINGGNITSNSYYGYEIFPAVVCYTPNLTITGGNITGRKVALGLYCKLDKTISGGTFKGGEFAIKSRFGLEGAIKDGYKVVDKNGNRIDPLGKSVQGKVRVIAE